MTNVIILHDLILFTRQCAIEDVIDAFDVFSRSFLTFLENLKIKNKIMKFDAIVNLRQLLHDVSSIVLKISFS